MVDLDRSKLLSFVEEVTRERDMLLGDVHKLVALQLDQRDKLSPALQGLLGYVDAAPERDFWAPGSMAAANLICDI